MGTREQLSDALALALEPGEVVHASRSVVANPKIEDRAYRTNLALLGPTAFHRAASGTIAGSGQMPERTNLVVVTDRRVLWCSRSRLGGAVTVGGSDALGVIHHVEVLPARVALAKLRFTFHDRSVVQFDLPSDHRAEEFTVELGQVLLHPVAA